MEIWQAIEAIATVGAAIMAGAAFWQARNIFQAQQVLNKEIHAEQVKLAQQQQVLSERIHREQIKLAQRQLFIPIFEQLNSVNNVDPNEPVWPDVIRAVNFLDLLGVCWEGQLVDEDILLRVFREIIVDIYDNVKRCKPPIDKKIEKDGETLLDDSRSATSLYIFVKAENLSRNRPDQIFKE